MNIEQARGLSLESFIKRLGYEEVRKGNAREAWFLSPLRAEKTASFKVDRKLNKWIDFGDGSKGDIVDFVRAYGPRRGWGTLDVSQSLERIASIAGEQVNLQRRPTWHAGEGRGKSEPARTPARRDDTFRIDRIGPLQYKKLIDYLRERKLHIGTAKEYLQQVVYTHTPSGRKYFGLTWENEAGGQEVRSPLFKTVIGSKAPSLIEVKYPHTTAGTAIFEGMTDYLSHLQLLRKEAMSRAIVLNGTGLYREAIELIKGLPQQEPVRAYLQNDEAGLKTTVKLKEGLPQLEIQNHKYAAYKDINDLLTGKPMTPSGKRAALKVLEGELRDSGKQIKQSRSMGD